MSLVVNRPKRLGLPGFLRAAAALFGGALVVTAAGTAAAAPPKLTGLFPSGVARGQSATITASGEFSAWPVEVWVDRPGLTVTVEAEKGKLKATAAADATPGVYWVRLTHAEGATALRPLIVGDGAPEIEEAEPNDGPDKPQIVNGTTVIHGRAGKAGDVDMFALKLRQGESLVAVMEANSPLGSPMDGVLQIVWLAGAAYEADSPVQPLTATGGRRTDVFVLEQDDDGGGYDPRASFVAPRDGWYAVRTFAFPTEPNSTIGFHGTETCVYRLTLSTSGLIEHPWPLALTAGATTPVRMSGWRLPPAGSEERPVAGAALEPNQVGVVGRQTTGRDGLHGSATFALVDKPTAVASESSDPGAPQAIEIPVVISGRIEAARDVDAFSFQAMKGRRVKFEVEARALGLPLDAYLAVVDSTGKVLGENDDAGKGRDPELLFTAPADGAYQLQIRDVHRHGGERYAYRLTAADAGRDFALGLAADAFVLAADKPLEIPVTIERRDGMAAPIALSVLGLPPGCSAAAVTSEPTGDSAKAVKVILSVDAGAKFPTRGVPIRIIGRAAGEPAGFRAATFTAAGATHQDVWLTLP